jgi:hypothetical protein
VLLVTTDGDLPVVVSPPDPAAFLAALDAGQDFAIDLPAGDGTSIRVLPLAGAHSPEVTLRIAGTGAPGYYTGLFRVDGVSTRVYATNVRAGVLVEGPARVYLSPEDVPGFLDAMRVAGAHLDA